jgi:hypothetical protein
MSAEAPVSHHLDLYRYWEAKKRDRRIPARRHIDPPADIPRLLPHIALIEAVDSAYRWRHMGTRIVDDLGCDLTGQAFGTNVGPSWYVGALTATFDRVLAMSAPVFEESVYTISSAGTHAVSRLLLPLAADGGTPAMILLSRITRRRPIERALNQISSARGQIVATFDLASQEELANRITAWEIGLREVPPTRVGPRPLIRIANLWGPGVPCATCCGSAGAVVMSTKKAVAA